MRASNARRSSWLGPLRAEPQGARRENPLVYRPDLCLEAAGSLVAVGMAAEADVLRDKARYRARTACPGQVPIGLEVDQTAVGAPSSALDREAQMAALGQQLQRETGAEAHHAPILAERGVGMIRTKAGRHFGGDDIALADRVLDGPNRHLAPCEKVSAARGELRRHVEECGDELAAPPLPEADQRLVHHHRLAALDRDQTEPRVLPELRRRDEADPGA